MWKRFAPGCELTRSFVLLSKYSCKSMVAGCTVCCGDKMIPGALRCVPGIFCFIYIYQWW